MNWLSQWWAGWFTLQNGIALCAIGVGLTWGFATAVIDDWREFRGHEREIEAEVLKRYPEATIEIRSNWLAKTIDVMVTE